MSLPHVPHIRIGAPTPVLQRWMELNGVSNWAFLTAWNPLGERAHDLEANIERNRQLMQRLQDDGYSPLPAWGLPDNPTWPPEASFLVLGMNRESARRVANQFNQVAFVYGERAEKSKKQKAKLVTVAGKAKDEYRETTYMVAPFNIHSGTALRPWLIGTQSRVCHFGKQPWALGSNGLRFQCPFESGVLGFFDLAPLDSTIFDNRAEID